MLNTRIPRPALLCSIQDDSGNEGGGGGGGNALEQQIAQAVNAAVTAQLSRKLGPALAAALGPIQEQIQALTPAPAPDTPDTGNAGDPGASDELANQVRALRQQVKAEQDARKREAERHRDAQASARLRDALTAAGVRKELLPGAVATLRDRLVARNDGTLVWRATRQGYHEDLEVEAGIAEWATTDIGKAHLAPADVRGSGQGRPGANGGPRPGPMPPDSRTAKRQRRQEARKQLFQQFGQMVAGGGRVAITPGPGKPE